MTCDPLIINIAPTGAVADATKNPAVPLDNAAIAAVVRECVDAGATICHLHVRDETAAPSSDPARFADLIGRIRGQRASSASSGSRRRWDAPSRPLPTPGPRSD